ncbi:hypothetical protein JET76_15225 [Pseudomonas putida]|uniref:Uncharacterized protein n=1 Tax=Pseudomonas putida TaxID=303 RepID=A0A7W2QJ40_PSEPU|nr:MULTISPECIES: hypothetical protein [Pseudomonas]MBA6116336.1 hypothetical protein [Pseudomonas putida]MBI6942704.1 hypothetical protein [Pseudomonas putida]MBI6958710.1 hypothetical protein [Pseudomonas putida]MCZ9639218.1 hypothetical protein [Pseudomonas putida]MEC4874838.1 hypothetical protein [Pseudomonas sp. NC26]
MVGITAVINSSNSAQVLNAGQAAKDKETEKTEEGRSTTQVDTSKLRNGGQAQGAEESSASEEPGYIKQLREMIKRMQKQLADEQKQLADLMAQKDEGTKLAAVTAKQASISTLTGEIMKATAQLLEALAKTGGSSAGGSVNTQA